VSEVLCIYYSRSGNTQRAMEEIGQALGAEIVRISDAVDRRGWRGWLRCGMDAVRGSTAPLLHFETDRPLEEYRLVIMGTPVWAGRCSAVARSFLKTYGGRLPRTAYVITRSSEEKYSEVFGQMDRYLPSKHVLAVSLRANSVGCGFWQEDFLRQVKEYLLTQQ